MTCLLTVVMAMVVEMGEKSCRCGRADTRTRGAGIGGGWQKVAAAAAATTAVSATEWVRTHTDPMQRTWRRLRCRHDLYEAVPAVQQ